MSGVDTYTKLMLYMDESPFVDSSASAHSLTLNGGIARTAAQSKFGGYSAYFDDIDDSIKVSHSTDFDFGTGDYTIDFWMYDSVQSSNAYLFDRSDNTDSFANLGLQFLPNGHLRLLVDDGTDTAYAIFQEGTTSIGSGSWYHIALVRDSGTTKLFIQGNLEFSNAAAYNVNYTKPLTIGVSESGTGDQFYNGYIDEFRVSKGIARWTTNFTPPTQQYNGDKEFSSASDISASTISEANVQRELNSASNTSSSTASSVNVQRELNSLSNITTSTQSLVCIERGFDSSVDIVFATSIPLIYRESNLNSVSEINVSTIADLDLLPPFISRCRINTSTTNAGMIVQRRFNVATHIQSNTLSTLQADRQFNSIVNGQTTTDTISTFSENRFLSQSDISTSTVDITHQIERRIGSIVDVQSTTNTPDIFSENRFLSQSDISTSIDNVLSQASRVFSSASGIQSSTNDIITRLENRFLSQSDISLATNTPIARVDRIFGSVPIIQTTIDKILLPKENRFLSAVNNNIRTSEVDLSILYLVDLLNVYFEKIYEDMTFRIIN